LSDRGISYEVRPRLVRGLDYYTRTTFEIVHGSLGAQNSVLGGGRYDGLAEDLGSKVPAPGIGFSIGEDRLVMSVEAARAGAHTPILDIYLAPLGEFALRHSGKLARDLRALGLSVELGTEAKLKRSLEIASKNGARFALILGDNEIASGSYALKNLATGQQQNVSWQELVERLKAD
jgi:histidyl-tRNA synthetase